MKTGHLRVWRVQASKRIISTNSQANISGFPALAATAPMVFMAALPSPKMLMKTSRNPIGATFVGSGVPPRAGRVQGDNLKPIAKDRLPFESYDAVEHHRSDARSVASSSRGRKAARIEHLLEALKGSTDLGVGAPERPPNDNRP